MPRKKRKRKKHRKEKEKLTLEDSDSPTAGPTIKLDRINVISKNWKTHIVLLAFLMIYSVVGGLLFTILEGHPESLRIVDIINARSIFENQLTEIQEFSNSMTEEEVEHFNARIMQLLRSYESELVMHFRYSTKILKSEYSELSWGFYNAVFYCCTIYTTLGYGHIVPVTIAGKSLTIAYASIGLPLFLLILADYSKMLTNICNNIWKYAHRYYLTGSFKKGRPLIIAPNEEVDRNAESGQAIQNEDQVNHEFKLPLSAAIIILIVYIFTGSMFIYCVENWTYFESVYYVFNAFTTIGLGDFIPMNRMFLLVDVIYIVIGLALTTMCFTVAQDEIKFRAVQIQKYSHTAKKNTEQNEENSNTKRDSLNIENEKDKNKSLTHSKQISQQKNYGPVIK